MIYYQRANGTYGYVETEDQVPPDATIIPFEEYPGPWWFQTDTSYGQTNDVDQIPAGGNIVTQAAYNALVAAAEAAQAAQFQLELQEAYQRYRDTFATYCGMGLPANVAATMAAAAGIMPPDFDPTTCPPAP